MVRPASVDSNGMKKGAWSEEEDNKLRAYVLRYGHWNWRLLPKYAGLARCGKSCRLRWVNYLKPGVKRGKFTKEEEELITELHSQLGNKWSVMATKLPGRTDNEIKNFYHTRIEKKRNKMHDQVNETSSSSSKNQEPSSEATNSFDEIHESTLSDPNTQSEVDFLPDLFKLDTTDYTPIGDTFPSLLEESNFFYPELHHYSELSSSGSSGLRWIGDDEHSNMSSEFATSWWPNATTESSSCNYQHEEISRQDVIMGGFYDPLFDNSFDYGMDLFS